MRTSPQAQQTGGFKKTLKAGIWYTLSTVLIKGATMLLTPIYARTMTLQEYGFNSTLGTWSSMLGMVVTADLGASVQRAKYEFPDQIRSYNSSIAFLGTLITLFFYSLVMIWPDFFCDLLGCRIEHIYIMMSCFLISPALGILQEENRLQNKYRSVVSITIGCWILSSGASLLILLNEPLRMAIMGKYGTDRVLSMHIGSSAPGFIINIVVYILLISRGRKLINWKYWRFALTICLPLIPHLLAGNILNNSDRIMITKLCGTDYTALYSITYTCAHVVSMLFNALNQAWVPWFNQQYFSHREQLVQRVTSLYYLLFFFISLGAIGLGPEALMLMGGDQYMQAVNMMPIVMISGFFQFTNAFLVNVEMFEKKTYFTAIGTSVAAALNVGLNALFIPVFDYQAAATTTLIGFAFLFVFHFFVCKKLIGNRLKQLYPLRLIFGCLGFMLLFIFPAVWMYSFTWPRYLIIAASVIVFFAVIFVKKNVIISYVFANEQTNNQ